MKFLQGVEPREYQKKIFETCKGKNCLVILPTGLGKTLIALMLTIDRMEKFPKEKVVFLAPTKPLAEQHLESFKKYLPELFADMQLFTGKVPAGERKKIWQTADIIFSTPQCIANDLKKGLYNLEGVCLLVEDEAHRCMKNYSYNYVAQAYRKDAENQRILGLTASPGSERNKIEEICRNLNIESLEIRTRDSDDVKEYLQERILNIQEVAFPSELEEIRQVLKKIHEEYIDELKSRKLLFEYPSKINLIKLQKKLGLSLSRGNNNFNLLLGMSACANAIKIQHTLELLETQTIEGVYQYLSELFKQARQRKSKGIQKLVAKPEFNFSFLRITELKTKNVEHPKVSKVQEIIKQAHQENEKTKSIIFTQYRVTANLISEKLNKEGIKSAVFIGQAKRNGVGMSQKEQKQIITDFSEGKINVLCATSIGEEGLDIPEVNKVIFYEPVPSEIRKIQRAGRTARLFPGELIILITKGTRDETFHWASFAREKRMHKTIKKIKEEMGEEKQAQLK
jgi:Fanconi anemia group M protein